jgi:hypothetical protein
VRASTILAERSVLTHFLLDLAKNLNAKSTKGRRWHDSTKHLYEVSERFCWPSLHSLEHITTASATHIICAQSAICLSCSNSTLCFCVPLLLPFSPLPVIAFTARA